MFPYIIKLIIYLSHGFAVSISSDWVNFKDGPHTSREQWGKHQRKLKSIIENVFCQGYILTITRKLIRVLKLTWVS